MQGDQDPFRAPSGTPVPSNTLQFSSHPDDMFNYPMSAPATAPVFTNTKPFWDPDTSMSGIDMNFSVDDAVMFDPTNSQRMTGSFDWGRSNQIFQDSANISFSPDVLQSSRRQAGRLPNASEQNFHVSMSDDPFAMVASTGAVDPGLLFSFPEIQSSSANAMSDHNLDDIAASRPSTDHVVRQPYQHQLRESQRDQEELRRSRSTRENSAGARFHRVSRSSPVKVNERPGLQRSLSESRPRRQAAQKNLPRQPVAEIITPSSRRRSSPLKHQNRTSLTSIPESVPGTRTSVTFSIDANGRARTETKIIADEPKTARGGPSTSRATSEDWDSESLPGSSSDDEPIILPSRNNSFKLTSQRGEGHNLTRFEASRTSLDERRRSVSDAGAFSRSSNSTQDDPESEAETIMDENDGTGDAAIALRKVMESKKPYSRTRKQPSSLHTTPRSRHQFGHPTSSNNFSPTTVSDPDLETPSTDRESSRSDSTRCVCNSRDGDTFMIQW